MRETRMKPGKIRMLALCAIRRGEAVLVQEGHDRVKGQTFYRLPGGGVEFGEYGREAAARELREELGAAITNVRYLGMLENIFTFEGQPGHEVALIYAAAFADPEMYTHEHFTGHEANGAIIPMKWMPLAGFRAGAAPLYPDGALDLLMRG
jgi:8-oxo-dGTP pyrophosphatase MutT (NUDIX family)